MKTTGVVSKGQGKRLISRLQNSQNSTVKNQKFEFENGQNT